ncbi:MAG: SDR family oxidoreductase [Chloroflexi bacterium]|nr:SDR family oxidoreductase [Chloroflexota bacterium]
MSRPDLSGKRILVAGVETDLGRTVAATLADSGATVAAVATVNDSDTAFATQRLARKLGGPGQALDGTNDMAVRVMVRQVSKGLGGLDAIVLCTTPEATPLLVRYGGKELDRSGGRHLIIVSADDVPIDTEERTDQKRPSWLPVTVRPGDGGDEATAEAVLRLLSGDQLLGS